MTTREVLVAELESSRERAREVAAELEWLREAHEQREMRLAEEVRQLNDRVREEKEKYTTLWCMNCAQLMGFDEAIADKDEEIKILKRRVHVLGEPAAVRLSIGVGGGGASVTRGALTGVIHRETAGRVSEHDHDPTLPSLTTPPRGVALGRELALSASGSAIHTTNASHETGYLNFTRRATREDLTPG